MFRARLLTAVVALPPLIWLLCCASPGVFSLVLLLCAALGLYEYFLLLHARLSFSFWWGIGWGLAVAGSVLFFPLSMVGFAIVSGFLLVFLLALKDSQPSQGLLSVSNTLLGVIYVGFLVPHLALLRHGPDGVGWTFFVFLVAMLGDTAGYGVGKQWGKHRLIPHISPGKTIEGSVGSVAGNLCGAGVAWVWFLPHRTLSEMLCVGFVAGIVAQMGDLCESAIKRAFGAKDSGRLFPGHGGILDRLDSLLFPAAFIYYYEKMWS